MQPVQEEPAATAAATAGNANAEASPTAVGQHQQSNSVDEVQVELKVHNISRDDLRHLESLLTQWALWHKATYAEGYSRELQLLSGLLALDVGRLRSEGVVDWLDTIGAVPGTGQPAASTAAGYEQAEAPPAYDRAFDELLAPAPDLTAAAAGVLPGGAAAARRRQLAESCLVEGGGADDTPAKRRRLPAQRCFNCGSYAHGIQQCYKPLDQARVSAARQDAQAARAAGGGGGGLLGRRYFNGSKDSPYEGLGPGKISEELAAALGLPDTSAPPPWLSRMAALGVPPRYADAADAGGVACLFTFITGSDDEDAAAGSDDANERREQQPEQQQLQQENGEHSAAAAAAAEAPPLALPGITAPIPTTADQHAWQVELDKGKYLAHVLKT